MTMYVHAAIWHLTKMVIYGQLGYPEKKSYKNVAQYSANYIGYIASLQHFIAENQILEIPSWI